MNFQRNSQRRLAVIIHFLTLIAFSAPALSAENDDALFEKIFKKKRPDAPAEVIMPIYYENSPMPMGQIKTLISKDGLLLESIALKRYLNALVDIAQPFESMVISGSELKVKDDTHWVPISYFDSAGFTLKYDDKKLEIRAHVPPELRKIRYTSISRFEMEEVTVPNLEPSFFSSYLNANTSQDYLSAPEKYNPGRRPLQAQLENGINMGGFVLESSARYVENKNHIKDLPSWNRGDIRLIHDSPSWRLRQTVGDLNYSVTGFQAFRPLAGLTLATQFSLEPSKLTVPTGNQDLFLKRPSKISVFINDKLVKTMDLPAGKHSLRDFPFASGPNDLKIDIVDDVGRTETIQLSYFSSTELLAPGLNHFSYSLGVPSAEGYTKRIYDSSKPAGAAFHRVGVLDNLTLGANFQGNKLIQMGGLETIFSTSLGAIKLEPATSFQKNTTPNYAFRSKYIWQEQKGKSRTRRSFGLTWEARSTDFTPLTDTPTPTALLHDITCLYSQSISDKSNVSATLGYQIYRKTAAIPENGYKAAINFSRSWAEGLSTNINFQHAKNGSGQNEGTLALFLSWNLSKEHQVVTASYDMKDDSTRVDWNYTPSNKVGGINAKAGVKKQRDERGFSGQLQRTGNRTIVSVSDDTTWDKDAKTPSNMLNAQLGTALVFAGGQFALTRPVSDSFVIVAPKKNLSGEILEINPEKDETYVATTDWVGNAGVPDLSSYNYSNIVIGTGKLTRGVNVEQDHFTLFPRFKSGYAIVLGTDASLSFSANLLGLDGKPIAMQPAKIRSLNDSSFAPITIFTGRTGKTRADGLKPGKYVLEFFDETWAPYIFEIPATASIIYDAGKIRIPLRQNDQNNSQF